LPREAFTRFVVAGNLARSGIDDTWGAAAEAVDFGAVPALLRQANGEASAQFLRRVLDHIVGLQSIPNDDANRDPYVHFVHGAGRIVIAPTGAAPDAPWKFTARTTADIRDLYRAIESLPSPLATPPGLIPPSAFFTLRGLAAKSAAFLLGQVGEPEYWQLLATLLTLICAFVVARIGTWLICRGPRSPHGAKAETHWFYWSLALVIAVAIVRPVPGILAVAEGVREYSVPVWGVLASLAAGIVAWHLLRMIGEGSFDVLSQARTFCAAAPSAGYQEDVRRGHEGVALVRGCCRSFPVVHALNGSDRASTDADPVSSASTRKLPGDAFPILGEGRSNGLFRRRQLSPRGIAILQRVVNRPAAEHRGHGERSRHRPIPHGVDRRAEHSRGQLSVTGLRHYEITFHSLCTCRWPLDQEIAIRRQRRPRPELRVVAFVAAQSLEQLFVSAVTIAEIRFGIELVADAHRRAALTDWLTHKVRPMFDQRVLPVTEEIMFKCRLLVEEGRKSGHTYSQPDLIVAATAAHHGLTIVSRDASEYQKARVPLLNPWPPSP